MANKIFVNEFNIEIQATKDDEAVGRLLSAFKTVHVNRAGTSFKISIRQLPEVLNVMRGITSSDDLPPTIKRLYDYEMERRITTEDLLLNGPTQEHDVLWPHQYLGVELARVNNRYGFFYDTRTGKTMMSLHVVKEAIEKDPTSRWLIVSSSYLVDTAWIPDLQKFYPELTWANFYGDDKSKLRAYVANTNILFCSSALLKRFVELQGNVKRAFAGCFFDESSSLKSHKTGMSTSALELSKKIPRWYLLSATPAPNDESEYYIQMLTLDPFVWPQSRTAFVGMYFDDESRSRNYEKLVLKRDMTDEFMNLIKQYSLYTDQSVMPTAGKKWNNVEFDMDADVREAYDVMRKNLALQVQGEEISVATAAIVRSKLRQIASGFIIDTNAKIDNKSMSILYGDDADLKQETYTLDMYRAYMLKALVTKIDIVEPNSKIVIWANFKEEFKMIKQVLGTTEALYVNGDTSTFKTQYIRAFKTNPKIKYIVAHPLSLGMGVNLTEAHHCIYYSLNDSWEQFKQSQERIAGHITVQPKVCIYWVMQANDSVDGIIYNNLLNKREKSFGILNHLRAGS